MLLALGAIVELETGVGATVVFEAEGATVVVFEAEGDREVITFISARLDATRQPIMMIRIFIFAKVAMIFRMQLFFTTDRATTAEFEFANKVPGQTIKFNFPLTLKFGRIVQILEHCERQADRNARKYSV